MADAYLYKFREGGREYQVILGVDHDNRSLEVIDSKRLSPWTGSDKCKTYEFGKLESQEGLSVSELEKLSEKKIDL